MLDMTCMVSHTIACTMCRSCTNTRRCITWSACCTRYGPTVNRDTTEDMQATDTSTCLQVLRCTFVANRENQVYCADFVRVFVSHLGHGLGASHCLKEMVKNNKELLDTKLDKDIVTKFIALIKERGRNRMFLSFLNTMCICDGEAVESNQLKLLEMVLLLPSSTTSDDLHILALAGASRVQSQHTLCHRVGQVQANHQVEG